MARKIEVEVTGDTKGLSRAFNDAAGSTSKFGSALGKTAKYAGLAIGAAGIGGLAITLKAGIAEFAEAAKVGAQTNAVIKSTGGAANVTAGEVSKLAEALMRKTGVDDEQIQSGENMLLTFTKVRNEVGKGNDIFDQATKASLNLSVALGKDMPSAAMLVGKALNDPIKGMTAMTRAGIQFTDAQKESIKAMVESGNVMGAQKVILAELETQFGGSAEAIGKTLPGQINILKESFSNMAGELVGGLVPAFTTVMSAVSDFVSRLGEAEGARAKLDVVWDAIKTGVTNLATGIRNAFNAIDWNAVGTALANGLRSALTFLASIDYGGILSNVATKLWNALKAAFNAINWKAVGDTVGDALVKALNAIASWIAKVDWNNVGQQLVHGIGVAIKALASFLAGVDWAAVLGALVRGIVAILKGLVGIYLGIATALGKAIATGIGNGLGNLAEWVKGKLRAIPDVLTSMIGTAASLALTIGKSIVSGILSGLGGLLGGLKDAVSGAIGSALGSIDIPRRSPPEHAAAEMVGKPLARGVIEGFLVGASDLPAKMAEKLRASLEAARAVVTGYQGVLGEAFSNLGDHIKRAFDAKTQNILDNVSKKFDAQIAKWQGFADALTPSEKALADLDAAEEKRSQDAALRAAEEQLAKARAMEEGLEKQQAIAAAEQALYQAQLSIRRSMLAEQAAAERAHREEMAAAAIAKLEESKARELQNLEERRRQQGESLAGQLSDLASYLSKHPGEYDKVNAKILKLMKEFGVPLKKAGENLGKAFAAGLRESFDEVEKTAKAIAALIAKYLKLKSPAERGPLSTLDRWFDPMGPMLAKSMLRGSGAVARAASGMAGVPAGASVAAAGGGAGGGGGRPLVVQFVMDNRVVAEQLYPHVLVVDKNNGGRMLNHGASVTA